MNCLINGLVGIFPICVELYLADGFGRSQCLGVCCLCLCMCSLGHPPSLTHPPTLPASQLSASVCFPSRAGVLRGFRKGLVTSRPEAGALLQWQHCAQRTRLCVRVCWCARAPQPELLIGGGMPPPPPPPPATPVEFPHPCVCVCVCVWVGVRVSIPLDWCRRGGESDKQVRQAKYAIDELTTPPAPKKRHGRSIESRA